MYDVGTPLAGVRGRSDGLKHACRVGRVQPTVGGEVFIAWATRCARRMEAIVGCDPAAIAHQVQRIARLLSVVYGADLNGIVGRLRFLASAATDTTSLRLAYLVCLDAEPSMQRYERSVHAGKYAVFETALRQRTEDLLDLRLDAHQYVQACCDAYVLA